MKVLENADHIAQVILTIVACIGVVFAYCKFSQESKAAKKSEKLQIAMQARDRWVQDVNEYTAPAVSFITENNTTQILIKVKNANEVVLCPQTTEEDKNQCINKHKRFSYGFLVSKEGIIFAKDINILRISLVKYLNAWENIARLYKYELADKRILKASFIKRLKRPGLYEALKPYVGLYSKYSWEVFRELAERFKKEYEKEVRL